MGGILFLTLKISYPKPILDLFLIFSLRSMGVQVNNQFQTLKEDIAVYPDRILCNPSADSSTIHVFTGTWMDGKKPLARKVIKQIKRRLVTKRRAGLYNRMIRKDRGANGNEKAGCFSK